MPNVFVDEKENNTFFFDDDALFILGGSNRCFGNFTRKSVNFTNSFKLRFNAKKC